MLQIELGLLSLFFLNTVYFIKFFQQVIIPFGYLGNLGLFMLVWTQNTILSVKKYYQLIPLSWRTRFGKAFPLFCHVKTLPYVKTLKRKTTKVEDFSSAQIVLIRFYNNFLIPSKNSTFFLFVLNYLIAVKLLEY